jgi:uncharacterized protein involved in exopolysaccharide biosynthesis
MIPEVSLRSTPSAPPTVDDDARALWKWAGTLAHAWGLLAVGAIVGGLLGWFATTRSAPLFEAVTTVAFNLPPERDDVFTTPSRRSVFMRSMFTSATVISGVVSELGLDREPFSFTPDAFRARALIVEDVATTNLMRLRVRLSSAETAAKAATAIAQRGIELTSRARRDAAVGEEGVLQKQLAAALEELTKAEQAWLSARLAPGSGSSRAARARVPRAVLSPDPSRGVEEKSLEVRLAESRGAAGPIGAAEDYSKQFDLVRLENEVEVRRAIFMDVADQLARVRLQVAATASPVQLLEPATVPKYSLTGTGKRTIALGALAGFVLAACFVVSREWRLSTRR